MFSAILLTIFVVGVLQATIGGVALNDYGVESMKSLIWFGIVYACLSTLLFLGWFIGTGGNLS